MKIMFSIKLSNKWKLELKNKEIMCKTYFFKKMLTQSNKLLQIFITMLLQIYDSTWFYDSARIINLGCIFVKINVHISLREFLFLTHYTIKISFNISCIFEKDNNWCQSSTFIIIMLQRSDNMIKHETMFQ